MTDKPTKINDDLIAKEHIVNEPEITDNSASPSGSDSATDSGSEALNSAINPEDAERDGRLLANGLKGIYETVAGDKNINQDQLDALEELGSSLFSSLSHFHFFAQWRFAFLALLIALPLVPPALKFIKNKNTKKEQPQNQGAGGLTYHDT